MEDLLLYVDTATSIYNFREPALLEFVCRVKAKGDALISKKFEDERGHPYNIAKSTFFHS